MIGKLIFVVGLLGYCLYLLRETRRNKKRAKELEEDMQKPSLVIVEDGTIDG